MKIRLALFPATEAMKKDDPDYVVQLGRLLRLSGFHQGRIIATADGYSLSELIYRPNAKHKKKPHKPTTAPSQPAVTSP